MAPRPRTGHGPAVVFAAIAATVAAGLAAGLLAILIAILRPGDQCDPPDRGAEVAIGPPGSGRLVGATEYGGPGDPSSGTLGASGVNLAAHPDSYAELGGRTFDTATAMGGLAYMTPLRMTWGRRSAIAYKRDFGLGGPPVAGLPRVIDLWWQLAGRLGIPYERGLWSGAIQVSRPPVSGAGGLLGQAPAQQPLVVSPPAAQDPALCGPASPTGVPVTHGQRARLLSDSLAAAPDDAPLAVKEMIASGNQIAGRPYLYGGAHGLPLSVVAPAYDCSSSVAHLLYGGGLLPVGADETSGRLESFGVAGVGRWVTVYANAGHVFMYVAGLRWDTHDAAGPGDGSGGIGWHPLIRDATGFVARHPVGL